MGIVCSAGGGERGDQATVAALGGRDGGRGVLVFDVALLGAEFLDRTLPHIALASLGAVFARLILFGADNDGGAEIGGWHGG